MKEQVLTVFEQSQVPLKAGEVADKAGLDKKLVDKAIKVLKEEGRIISPKKCYYSFNK